MDSRVRECTLEIASSAAVVENPSFPSLPIIDALCELIVGDGYLTCARLAHAGAVTYTRVI